MCQKSKNEMKIFVLSKRELIFHVVLHVWVLDITKPIKVSQKNVLPLFNMVNLKCPGKDSQYSQI